MVLLAQLWAHGVMVAYTHRVTLPLTLTHRGDLDRTETSSNAEIDNGQRKKNNGVVQFKRKLYGLGIMVS